MHELRLKALKYHIPVFPETPPTGSKRCSTCKTVKLAVGFSKHKYNTDGLMSYCKECGLNYGRNKRASRTEDQKQSDRDKWAAWYSKNRDSILEYAAKRYENNTEHIKAVGSAWRKANREIANTFTVGYRCRVRLIPGSHSTQEWVALCEKFDKRCVCCGETKSLARDHIYPTNHAKCSNSIENIQPLCKSCNSRKHQKAIDYLETPFAFSGKMLQ